MFAFCTITLEQISDMTWHMYRITTRTLDWIDISYIHDTYITENSWSLYTRACGKYSTQRSCRTNAGQNRVADNWQGDNTITRYHKTTSQYTSQAPRKLQPFRALNNCQIITGKLL